MGRGSIRKALIPEEKVTIKSNPLQALLQPIQAILIGFFANTQTDNATVSTGASSCTDGDEVHGIADPGCGFHGSADPIQVKANLTYSTLAIVNRQVALEAPFCQQLHPDGMEDPSSFSSASGSHIRQAALPQIPKDAVDAAQPGNAGCTSPQTRGSARRQ